MEKQKIDRAIYTIDYLIKLRLIQQESHEKGIIRISDINTPLIEEYDKLCESDSEHWTTETVKKVAELRKKIEYNYVARDKLQINYAYEQDIIKILNGIKSDLIL